MKHVVKLKGVPYFKRRGYGAHQLPQDDTFNAAYDRHLAESEACRDALGILGPSVDVFLPRVRENLRSAKKRAAKQGVEFSISESWFVDKYTESQGRCALTGIAFSVDRPKRPPFAPSVDRIEPNLGYTPENCRLVTYIANCARNQFSDAEFRQMCRGATRNWDRTEALKEKA